jgi:hypothetical protein
VRGTKRVLEFSESGTECGRAVGKESGEHAIGRRRHGSTWPAKIFAVKYHAVESSCLGVELRT